jgi:CRISPR-associated endonuclease/helicase Cas3
VTWGSPDTPVAWDDLAARLAESFQTLCIVNLKRHAKALWEKVNDPVTLHLSTNLCAAHRQDVLASVCARLGASDPVRLIATQCVEAGVDLDFPVVMRAWGPLDAIIQAAGRCNREGRRKEPGQLQVFLPEDEAYSPGGYEQAAHITKMLFRRFGEPAMNLEDPGFIQRFASE